MALLSALPNTTCAGDVNGDGLDDLIVGAAHADLSGKLDAGKSYVVFGKADTSFLPFRSARVAPTIKSSKPSPLTSPALETEMPFLSVLHTPT
jgi:hypothetical protein